MIRASCHCGAVGIEADRLPRSVAACNCSICGRLGALPVRHFDGADTWKYLD